jgi:hypothetical protein
MAPCVARFLYTQIDYREHKHVGHAPQRALRARNTGRDLRITVICILTPLGDGCHEKVRRRREESQRMAGADTGNTAHEGTSVRRSGCQNLYMERSAASTAGALELECGGQIWRGYEVTAYHVACSNRVIESPRFIGCYG